MEIDTDDAPLSSNRILNGTGNASPGDGDASATRYLALDTNVLLNHSALVRSLYQCMLVGDAWLLVPSTVVNELDGLKNSVKSVSRTSDTTVGEVARSVTSWLLDIVRAQRRGAAGRVRLERWSDAERTLPGGDSADDSILACCLYFAARDNVQQVTLWTDDRNLALRAEANGIPTLGGRVSLAKVCAAVAVAGEAMEAMEVDGTGLETDDADLPLFSRRRRGNESFYGKVNGNGSFGYTHANGAASAPNLSGSHPHLPPPGALAAALAELARDQKQIPGAPTPSSASTRRPGANTLSPPSHTRRNGTSTQPKTAYAPLPPAGSLAAELAKMSPANGPAPSSSPAKASVTQSSASASACTSSAFPPPGALAAVMAELAAMPNTNTSKPVPSAKASTSTSSPATTNRNTLTASRGAHPAGDSAAPPRFSPYASNRSSTLTSTSKSTTTGIPIPTATTKSTSTSRQIRTTASSTSTPTLTPQPKVQLASGRSIPATLAASLTAILSTACSAIAPGDLLPTDPSALASTLFDQLAGLLSRESGDDNPGARTMSAYARPLAVCTGAARTLKAWLAGTPGGRRVRDGEAADAALVLCRELSGQGMVLDKAQWEAVARDIRLL